MKTRNKFALFVISPLIIGGLIYALFRTDSLFMFHWFNRIGIGEIVTIFRQNIENINLTPWIIYSLPDALWVFSFTNLMLIIWKNNLSIHSLPWILIAPAIGLFLEIGQALHIFHGTFDLIDLLLTIFASILPFIPFINKIKLRTI